MPRGEHKVAEGDAREKSILASLKRGDKTAEGIAEDIGASRSTVAMYLKRFHGSEPKQAYVSGHQLKGRGRPAPVWSIGDLPDVEYIPLECPTPKKKPTAEDRRNQVLAILRKKPGTCFEIGDGMWVVHEVANKYIKQLRDATPRQVFILKWLSPRETHPDNPRASSWTPVYAFGDKQDAPAPKKETSAERYARLKTSAEFRRRMKAKRKVEYAIYKAKKKRNGIFAALGL